MRNWREKRSEKSDN